MTGLNLEPFLHLVRADLGAWATLGLIVLVLGLMAWASWGSRRALRKCLVLSVAVHVGLVVYGSSLPALQAVMPTGLGQDKGEGGIREIRVAPVADGSESSATPSAEDGSRRMAPWDRPEGALALADPALRPDRPETPEPEPLRRSEAEAVEPEAPEINPPEPPGPGPRPKSELAEGPPLTAPEVAPADPSEIRVAQAPQAEAESDDPTAELGVGRLRPDRGAATAPGAAIARAQPRPAPLPEAPGGDLPKVAEAPEARPLPGPEATAEVAAETASSGPRGRPRAATDSDTPVVPEADLRRRPRPGNGAGGGSAGERPRRSASAARPIALAPTTPGGIPGLSDRGGAGGRALADVPEPFRPRLDPNRSALARGAGASEGSERAVARALDWLARHQDADGRWNGGSQRVPVEGLEAEGRTSFTAHCPAGDVCAGECHYIEADTALTGLALLAYLGGGHTHTGGRYAEVVGRGIDYLLRAQKADGDLRGPSRAVGMYCHAMAALALCEAYALTADARLRGPAERSVEFLARSQARDGLSWRYAPREPIGDTSILGWVVLAMKSAQDAGLRVSQVAQRGAIGWLGAVSSGSSGGLASYQPARKVTPTMTAEAWVCRQFLGVGGPGPASDEAADYLLRSAPDRGPYNLYYWYYGTLAMFQHGGSAWTRWNDQVREQLVRRQRARGHAAGSWDPDDDLYGSRGGRIYSTSLAALTLEVYYRYGRADAPPRLAPGLEADPTLRRAGRPDARPR
jgi:hypothetical protein